MQYVCIKCHATWHEGKESPGPSGGICDSCITEYVRAKQTGEGNHDCFRRAVQDCSELDCKYRDSCLRYIVDKDKKRCII